MEREAAKSESKSSGRRRQFIQSNSFLLIYSQFPRNPNHPTSDSFCKGSVAIPGPRPRVTRRSGAERKGGRPSRGRGSGRRSDMTKSRAGDNGETISYRSSQEPCLASKKKVAYDPDWVLSSQPGAVRRISLLQLDCDAIGARWFHIKRQDFGACLLAVFLFGCAGVPGSTEYVSIADMKSTRPATAFMNLIMIST